MNNRNKQTRIDFEIRGDGVYFSNELESSADINLLEDTHHHQLPDDTATDSRFLHYDRFVIYVEDNHDVSWDLDIISSAHHDTDYSGGVEEATLNIQNNQDQRNQRFDGVLLGRMRFRVDGLGSAPTSGKAILTIQALGRT